MVELLGWTATAIFISSYFASKAETMRTLQLAGGTVWLAYGVGIDSRPVIVSNVLLCAAAAWTLVRARRLSGKQPQP